MKLMCFWSLILMTLNLMAETLVVNKPAVLLWRTTDTAYNQYYTFEKLNDGHTWSNVTNAIFSKWFVGKMESQLIYGEEVEVLEAQGDWYKVQVPGQKTVQYHEGYVGWVLKNTLMPESKESEGEKIVITNKIVSLYYSAKFATILERNIPYGTKLSLIEKQKYSYKARLVDGRVAYVKIADAAFESLQVVSGEKIVTEARKFLGTRYLWAGTTPKGFDCSGLTYRIINTLGGEIMRDAADQYSAGQEVAKDDLQPGDLVFFARDNAKENIHHVGIYVGNNSMIHSPKSGYTVRLEKFNSGTWAATFAGARRYF